ncbi:hypothetical protein LWI28_024010 [Acer negundo]|uniref:LOB domain-containing protein n=1 Tax=Acer negundo TaxID=4023 RepID=A0AAD5JBJ8_ACENE|nr:hypothetical protein LWI28_024010 [Acer negundo]KAK4854647.1 hypothetical protein QYF36_027167 [Acer negundo]
MDRNQNQRPAGAACNHHRRRCPPNCFIAKYFPHDQSVNFADAHKLFGIGNIVKWAKDVERLGVIMRRRNSNCQSLDLYRPKGFQDFHNLQPNPFSKVQRFRESIPCFLTFCK